MDWIAAIFELTGTWNLGNKRKVAFVLLLIGNIFWVITALTIPLYGLLLVTIPAIVINIRNYYKWYKSEQETNSNLN